MPLTLIPDSITTNVNERLDQLEEALPAVPARLLRFQRTAAASYCERTSAVWSSIADSTRSFFDTARVSGKTVTGQAREAATDVAKTARAGTADVVDQAREAATDVARSARSGTNRVRGQAAAQGRRVAKAAEAETVEALDDAIEAFDDSPGRGTPYEQWTKAQLLERAQELDIEGRSGMSKGELIAALRAS